MRQETSIYIQEGANHWSIHIKEGSGRMSFQISQVFEGSKEINLFLEVHQVRLIREMLDSYLASIP